MTEQQEQRLARERAEIAERVKNFRATQKKFEQEREDYYKTTLSNAWDGFNRPVVLELTAAWSLRPTKKPGASLRAFSSGHRCYQ